MVAAFWLEEWPMCPASLTHTSALFSSSEESCKQHLEPTHCHQQCILVFWALTSLEIYPPHKAQSLQGSPLGILSVTINQFTTSL